MKSLTISKADLANVDMKNAHNNCILWASPYEYYQKQAGDEMYRLLAFFSHNMPDGSLVVDIGTYYGLSTCALAANANVNVKTYDIYDHISSSKNDNDSSIHDIANVQVCIKDCLEDTDTLQNANIILLDVDPHDGVQELEIVQKLREVGFKGILLCDDIRLNDGMKSFWNSIHERKMDITEYGHWSGTGIVFFSDDIDVQFVS